MSRGAAELVSFAAKHGYTSRKVVLRCLDNVAATFGVDASVLTADFAGADLLRELEEVGARRDAESGSPPSKRHQASRPAAPEVISLSDGDDFEDGRGRAAAAARPSQSGRITAFFTKQPSVGTQRPTQARPAQQPAQQPLPSEAECDDLALANRVCFGNTAFRPTQRAICEAVVAGKDVFVLMPTGGGKSLCYQLPAVLSPGVTVVCSPLLSLIQDQVTALVRGSPGTEGIPASYLSSQQSSGEYQAVLRELKKTSPTMKLLYVTPEQLVNAGGLNDVLRSLAERRLLARFVIDEAHCVCTWGHSFRADYKALGVLRQRYPRVPIVALTATATEKVKADVLKILGIDKRCAMFKGAALRAVWHAACGSLTTRCSVVQQAEHQLCCAPQGWRAEGPRRVCCARGACVRWPERHRLLPVARRVLLRVRGAVCSRRFRLRLPRWHDAAPAHRRAALLVHWRDARGVRHHRVRHGH